MKLKTSIFLALLDLVMVFMVMFYVGDRKIQISIVSVLLLGFLFLSYKIISELICILEGLYLEVKNAREGENRRWQEKYEERAQETKRNFGIIYTGINEINNNITSLNSFIDDGNREVKKVFSAHVNKIENEFSTSYLNNMRIIDNMRNTFESKISQIGNLFNEEIVKIKEDLINGINIGNEGLYKNLDSNLTLLSNNIEKNVLELKDGINSNSNKFYEVLNTRTAEINTLLDNWIISLNGNISTGLKGFTDRVDILSTVSKESIVNIENMSEAVRDFESGLTNRLNLLINNEEEILNSLEKRNKELKDSLNDNLEKIRDEILQGNSRSVENIIELKGVLSDVGILYDDGLKEFRTSLSEENNKNIFTLSNSLEKNIKEMSRRIIDENKEWKDASLDVEKNNSTTIIELKRLILELSKLHKEVLNELENNQKRMMELSDEDIKLMREMIV